MLSLRALSNHLSVSKMTVINHYRNLVSQNHNIVNHTKIVNGKRIFDDKLVTLIVRSFNKKQNPHHKPRRESKYKSELINNLKQENKDKNNEIKRLNVRLEHEQELNLEANKQLLTYQKRSKHNWIWKLFH